LAIDFRLVEVRVEVARIGSVAHIHGEPAEVQSVAYFGKARENKSHDYDP